MKLKVFPGQYTHTLKTTHGKNLPNKMHLSLKTSKQDIQYVLKLLKSEKTSLMNIK